MNESDNICTVCGESKDPSKARFAHVRIGLDEPPEPVLCKCKSPIEILNIAATKYRAIKTNGDGAPTSYMDMEAPRILNPVIINSVASKATREVELRLNPELARRMYMMMEAEFFGNAKMDDVVEVGCSWWTGAESNMVSKVRMRSNGESVVKVGIVSFKVAPGYVLGVSDEYRFDGIIVHPQYTATMTELTCTFNLTDVMITAIARAYGEGDMDKRTFAAEFEIQDGVSNSSVLAVLSMAISTVGTVKSMTSEVNFDYMRMVRSTDHIVVDIPSMEGYTGPFMAKADGVKKFVFCYPFGYVVTLTDPTLTVMSCVVTSEPRELEEVIDMPDVMVVEEMMDGVMVHIGTLAVDGTTKMRRGSRGVVSNIRNSRPMVIFRKSWDRVPSKTELVLSGVANDGVVLVTELRTTRLKAPTVDLLYSDGTMNVLENGSLVVVANGSDDMEEGVTYECDLHADTTTGVITIVRPKMRILKKLPNSMEVARRAVMTVTGDPNVNGALLDITAMSVAMRTRVYEMTQSRVGMGRKVIVSFGTGRVQEWRQMMTNRFSYIVIDPEIDVTVLERRVKGATVMPYDFNTSFNLQTIAASRKGMVVLWAKCRSEDFLRKTMPTRVMSATGIPAVFSFSISYHVGVVSMLRSSGVPVFGCGYVHDSMPQSGVGREPVTMIPVRTGVGTGRQVVARFGKSTYVEPFLSRASLPNLVLVRDAMPELWANVDSGTAAIMERAVLMCG